MELTERVLAAGLDAGLDRVGVCSADPFPEVRTALVERKEAGLSGGLAFTFSRPDTATDPRNHVTRHEVDRRGNRTVTTRGGVTTTGGYAANGGIFCVMGMAHLGRAQ